MPEQKIQRLNCKQFSPDPGFAVLDVPQATACSMWGPCGENKELRFMKTSVGPCVALALVGWRPNEMRPYPYVLLSHFGPIGGAEEEDYEPGGASFLVKQYSRGPKRLVGLHAYVASGDGMSKACRYMLRDLKAWRVPVEVELGCHLETLVIDSVDGLPLSCGSIQKSAQYNKSSELERYEYELCQQALNPINLPVHYLSAFEQGASLGLWERSGPYPSRNAEELIAAERYEMQFDSPRLAQKPEEAKPKEETQAPVRSKSKAAGKFGQITPGTIPVVSIKDYRFGGDHWLAVPSPH